MLHIDLLRIWYSPLRKDTVWTFLGCILFGLGWLFWNDPVIHEALLFGFVTLAVILAIFAICLLRSNIKLTHE